MRNKIQTCISKTNDSHIKFEENKRKIVFLNPDRLIYHKVQVDGCVLCDGIKCDKLLLSNDEHEEYYVELKGTDVMHAIDQLENTIFRLGDFDENRHSYIVCTNVSPACNTQIQKKQKYFMKKFKSELVIKEKQHTVSLN